MRSPYSTKRPKPIPAEFRDFFLQHGWQRCNLTFGKRETLRYVTALGLAGKRRAVQDRENQAAA